MTLIIIAITVLISVTAFQNLELKSKLMFNAYLVKHSNQWYRVVSHAFIHADWTHLGINMWVLWMFGSISESAFEGYKEIGGQFIYLTLYIGGILFATLSSFRKHQDNFGYNSLGASGAVAAVLFSSIYFNPTMTIYFMMVIPIPAGIFGVLYLALEWYMDKKSNDNVAHDAHFWGAAFGFVFSVIMVPERLQVFIYEITGHLF